jgi:hypothetical protein
MALRQSAPEFVELPEDEKHKDYFALLVRNCIAAYGKTYNDKLALDYNQVTGKMRSLVLDNDEYKKQTRSIRAKRIVEEAEELEELAALAEGIYEDDEDDQDLYDPRNSGKKRQKKSSADKDEINLRFKVAQERRAFLNLDSHADETEEADALNLFFVPVTREEFEQLDTVEVSDGDGDGSGALAEASDQKADVDKRLAALAADANGAQGKELAYVVNADGTIEEL